MHDLLKDLSHLANTKHIRVTRKAKQIAGSYQNNIAEQNKMVVLPALRQLSSAALSEEKTTLEDVFEPYLMQEGFIQRTPRGRTATAKAYQHLGRELPKGFQSSLL